MPSNVEPKLGTCSTSDASDPGKRTMGVDSTPIGEGWVDW